MTSTPDAVVRNSRRRAIETAPPSPELEAEAERLLAGRTRDITFSRVMQQRYLESSWIQRSKIAQAWMIWVTLIDLFFLPFSRLMVASDIRIDFGLGLVLLPDSYACAYLLWRRPRRAWVEGLSILVVVTIIMCVYGTIGFAGGGIVAERYATGALFATTIAIIVFDIGFVWTLATAATSLMLFAGFLSLNPAVGPTEVAGTIVFYTMGVTAVIYARHTATLLARRAFLMVLRDRYRSAALTRSNSQLEALTRLDPMTGLANRRSMVQHIDRIWQDDALPKSGIAFIMADLDRFKQLNDTRGHAAGDTCIKRVADVIGAIPRCDLDLASRYGGEEFLIVLTDVTPKTAHAVAERLRADVEALAGPTVAEADRDVSTISIGMAFARDGAAAELVMKWADDALYEAKRHGGNRVAMSSSGGGNDMAAATLVPSSDEAGDDLQPLPDRRHRVGAG